VTVVESHAGPCLGVLPPMGIQRVQVVGFGTTGVYDAVFPVVGGGVFVYWDFGTHGWRTTVQRGPVTADGPLTWDATAGVWTGHVSAPCPPGVDIDYLVVWTPETYASVCINRSMVDEDINSSTEVLSWDQSFDWLAGATSVSSDLTTGIWRSPPRAGPFHQVGTSALPRAGGQKLRFEF
jgi:hypothetical protein